MLTIRLEVYADKGSYRNLFHGCGFSYQQAAGAYKSRPSEADIADFEAELEKKRPIFGRITPMVLFWRWIK